MMLDVLSFRRTQKSHQNNDNENISSTRISPKTFQNITLKAFIDCIWSQRNWILSNSNKNGDFCVLFWFVSLMYLWSWFDSIAVYIFNAVLLKLKILFILFGLLNCMFYVSAIWRSMLVNQPWLYQPFYIELSPIELGHCK